MQRCVQSLQLHADCCRATNCEVAQIVWDLKLSSQSLRKKRVLATHARSYYTSSDYAALSSAVCVLSLRLLASASLIIVLVRHLGGLDHGALRGCPHLAYNSRILAALPRSMPISQRCSPQIEPGSVLPDDTLEGVHGWHCCCTLSLSVKTD